MLKRSREKTETVDWGNGTSDRLLVEDDNLGFTVAHTVVRAGTVSRLQYANHLEACYCIAGSGLVESADGGVRIDLSPGVLYALDQHDPHLLIASEHEDLELVSVFNPPLRGDERHDLDALEFSSY
ncbi:ectoine synthase [Nocardiopsis dassonvillei]|jgi:L-ectoine synthase|uniref:ectoine synthase n=1 Tax=Nocardiopsis dassonvillei TaxID=2014 RepID=UPI00102C21F0|nr:ectoine synthase [Nocardiopsis dassonvillei]MCP3012225.1 ectoine synthase [Nocardiopsis dassonvillei]